jgi:hypothetical protein
MNDICIPPQYTPYINRYMEKIINLAKSNLFTSIGLLLISFIIIYKMINVIILISFIYLIYLLFDIHKERFKNIFKKKSTENFCTDNIYFDGLDNVISENIKVLDKTEEIKKFNYQQDNSMILASWNPNRYIKKIDENGKPIYDYIYDDKFNLTLDEKKTLSDINPIDGIAENNFGMSLKDLYDKSITNYKKIEPKMTLDESDNIKKGASNLSSYSQEDWSYKNEKELNGGVIGDLYAANSSNSIATF